MQVTALGHAGLRVEADGTAVVVDPWVSPEGAFQASWFPYPDNAHVVTPELFEPAAVVLSHEHLDHLDPWYLARVASDVPVIVPRYPSPVVRRKVLAAGQREIVEVDPWELVEPVPGFEVMFVPEESPMNHDAAVVIRVGDRNVLDLNDARLSPMQLRGIRSRVGDIDMLLLQAAGASWYPMCYRYGPERMRELTGQKRLAKFAYMASTIRIVEPVVAVPFAGPPCFLDPELAVHNGQMDGGIFPDQSEALEWLAAHGVDNTELLLPGDRWDLDARRRHPHARSIGFDFGDRDARLAEYAARRRPDIDAVRAQYPEPEHSMWPAFESWFTRLLGMSPWFNARIDMRVGFHITGPGGGDWAVDFRPGHEGVFDELGDCAYHHRFESRWLPPLLDGRVPWEDFLLSLRFEAWRSPDLYSDHLLGLLKFADPAALQAVQAYEESMNFDDRILVHAEGRTYSIARRCPHAGNDLDETGEVLPGRVIRCLAHHYEFDLETGTCLNGRSAPLSTQRLDALVERSGP